MLSERCSTYRFAAITGEPMHKLFKEYNLDASSVKDVFVPCDIANRYESEEKVISTEIYF